MMEQQPPQPQQGARIDPIARWFKPYPCEITYLAGNKTVTKKGELVAWLPDCIIMKTLQQHHVLIQRQWIVSTESFPPLPDLPSIQ